MHAIIILDVLGVVYSNRFIALLSKVIIASAQAYVDAN